MLRTSSISRPTKLEGLLPSAKFARHEPRDLSLLCVLLAMIAFGGTACGCGQQLWTDLPPYETDSLVRSNFPIGQARSTSMRNAARLGLERQTRTFYTVGGSDELLTYEEAAALIDALPADSPDRALGRVRAHALNPLTYDVRNRSTAANARQFSTLELFFDDFDALRKVSLTPTHPDNWRVTGYRLEYE